MKKTLKTMILALAGLSLFSCGQEPTESSSKSVESTKPTPAFTPVELKSCGSTSVDKVITALGAKFADLTGNKVTLKKDQHGSGDATTGVTAGKNNTKYDIGFLSREIKDSEKTVLTEANKTGKMCKDAVVPIVNSANAYSATDKATLVAIYKGEKKPGKKLILVYLATSNFILEKQDLEQENVSLKVSAMAMSKQKINGLMALSFLAKLPMAI